MPVPVQPGATGVVTLIVLLLAEKLPAASNAMYIKTISSGCCQVLLHYKMLLSQQSH